MQTNPHKTNNIVQLFLDCDEIHDLGRNGDLCISILRENDDNDGNF